MKSSLFLLVPLLCSCSSMMKDKTQTVSDIALQSCAVGGRRYLEQHPAHRNAFSSVAATTTALQRAGNTNLHAAVEMLSALPTDALSGPDGALYVSAPVLVIWDEKAQRAVRVSGPAVAPVMKSISQGMRLALVPAPPLPRKPSGSQPSPVQRPPVNPPSLGTGTNVTRSIVDVAEGTLTIRWRQAPGSLYSIQRQAPNGWVEVHSVANPKGTGETNWSTAWPVGTSAGQWRVVRTRGL